MEGREGYDFVPERIKDSNREKHNVSLPIFYETYVNSTCDKIL